MKYQLWKYWKGHRHQLLYCATKKNCYSAECWLETIQGRGICSLVLSPPAMGYLAAYVASPLGIFYPRKKKTLMPWWGSGGVEGGWEQEMTEAQEFSLRARLKKGKGRGRGRKLGKGKGTLSPQFLASLPQATRVYNLIYGRPGTILPSIRPENRLFLKSYALESFIEQMSPEFGKK